MEIHGFYAAADDLIETVTAVSRSLLVGIPLVAVSVIGVTLALSWVLVRR